MNNAECKKVISETSEQIKNAHHRGRDFTILASDTQFWSALSHCLIILEKLEQKGGVLPEEKEEFTRWTDQPIIMNRDWNACRQQIALNLVAFEKRLPEIIDKHCYSCDGSRTHDKKLSQAISAELRGQ